MEQEEGAQQEQQYQEIYNDFQGSLRTFQCGESKVLSCRMESNGVYMGMGCEDGRIRVFREDKDESVYVLSDAYNKTCPVTQVRWKDNTKYENIMVTGHADGSVLVWHVTSRQMLKNIAMPDNPIYGLDFAPNSSLFATGGQDTKVRLYNLDRLSQTQTLDKQGAGVPQHGNRIFSIKWVDSNCLLSAGWDKVVLLWDIRVKAPQSYLYGPSVCGDSLDFSNKYHQILTAQYDKQEQIQIWDIRRMAKVLSHSIPPQDQQDYYVYAAQFNKHNQQQIMVGTAGIGELQLYEQENNTLTLQARHSFPKGIYSIDCQPQTGKFLFSGDEGQSGVVEFKEE